MFYQFIFQMRKLRISSNKVSILIAYHIKNTFLSEDNPFIKHYTLASSGNSNEIKIWTITCHSKSKCDNTPNSIAISLADVYDGHCSAVTCVRYNHTGSYLASSSLDKLVKLWDNSGVCLATLEGHTRYVNCIAFSRDGNLVVSGIKR